MVFQKGIEKRIETQKTQKLQSIRVSITPDNYRTSITK